MLDEIIPRKNEIFFILKLISIMIVSLIISSLILYVFLGKNLSDSYASAFKIMSDLFDRMNLIIIIAVFVQLCLSSILLFVVALLFSHKIAGPMFRLKRLLTDFRDGVEPAKITFRRTDFLPGVSKWFSEFFTRLQKREMLLNEAETLLKKTEIGEGKENKTHRERIRTIITELENGDVA